MARAKWLVIELETRIEDAVTQQPLSYEQHAHEALKLGMHAKLFDYEQTEGPKRIYTETVIAKTRTAKAAWEYAEQYHRDHPKYAFDRRYTYDVQKEEGK